jgi:hypothetical protein
MPFKLVWVPAPKDESLPVFEEEPSKEEGPSYHCRYCNGWIKGEPNRFKENTIGPLSGRKGTALHCIRCGNEIDFFGMHS